LTAAESGSIQFDGFNAMFIKLDYFHRNACNADTNVMVRNGLKLIEQQTIEGAGAI
jgi:hypothetical protein